MLQTAVFCALKQFAAEEMRSAWEGKLRHSYASAGLGGTPGCRCCGVDDYITKPIEFQKLPYAVSTHIE